MALKTKIEIVKSWLPRYTGTPLDGFGEYILLTNFSGYVQRFSKRFNAPVLGMDRPMQTCTNKDNLTMVNFGIGSANAATIMDLLSAINPKGVLFLGKCGGIKKAAEIGHFILPIAAIRGEGTSDDYLPKAVPALPSFKLHKFVSEKIVEAKLEYRTGVIYTTNRRVWEHDEDFKKELLEYRAIAIDMETATLFSVGIANEISRGALLLVSDMPMTPEGVKTEESDKKVTHDFVDIHIDIGIRAMTEIGKKGEPIKHFHY
ncbi:MAG: AMP nucleosidase [Oligoflexales bacterium]